MFWRLVETSFGFSKSLQRSLFIQAKEDSEKDIVLTPQHSASILETVTLNSPSSEHSEPPFTI